MLTLTYNNGVVNLSLPDKHARQALALFQTALADTKITEITTITNVTESAQPTETEKPMYDKFPPSVKFLEAHEAADVIINYIMDKAERTYGNRYPYQMQRFFRALEAETEVNITREHKKRLYGSGRPHMRGHKPLRKIDAAIDVLGAEEIYKFAKSFNFISHT